MCQRAYLIYLSPLASLFFHEARVNGGHDLVEMLTGNIIETVAIMGDTQTHKLKVLRRSDLGILVGLKRAETGSRRTLGQFLASRSSSLPF